MVLGERLLIDIGYRYNSQKFLSFVSTVRAGSTMLGIPYLFMYPDQFSNFSIRNVARPHLMSKFFGQDNEIDSHNKPRHLNLAMENFWVTQCGWLRLCTTVVMDMKINNCWKLFRYGISRDPYDKFIGIRKFS